MAGYSETPLVRKLGFKEGMKILFLDAPDDYIQLIPDLPPGCSVAYGEGRDMDLVHLFARNISDLENKILKAKESIHKNGILWISWAKKSSALYSDLDGNTVREMGLSTGLVDIKVCAVDDTWSALKFVYRVKDR